MGYCAYHQITSKRQSQDSNTDLTDSKLHDPNTAVFSLLCTGS